MAKTKAELIETRKSTYRDQMPAECCGTCRHFRQNSRWDGLPILRGRCHAIVVYKSIKSIPTAFTGKCDLYEPKGA